MTNNESSIEFLKSLVEKQLPIDSVVGTADILDLLECSSQIYRHECGQHRWWNDYEYVVRVEGRLFKYVGAEANRDESMGDLGWDFDIKTIEEVESVKETVEIISYNSYNMYDSTEETLKHINKVKRYLDEAALDLRTRGRNHDASKLLSPEKEYFDLYTPELEHLTYGTEEYRESCRKLKPAIDHHYSVNDHHPQFWEKGINGMNLYSLLEMLLDWKASTERGIGGDILKSIDINAERFGISKQLRQILINTVEYDKNK